LKELNPTLTPDITVKNSDVLAAWSGIRPLVKDPSAVNTQEVVRNHMIHVSESGLLTIAGGKWTTYRNMAYETIEKAIQEFDLKPLKHANTENVKLIGSHGYSRQMYLKLIQQYGLDVKVAEHLVDNYGDRAFTVASLTEVTDKRWPLFGVRLSPEYPYLEAEVRYACRYEYANSAADVLGRRTRLAFLDCYAALDALPRVIEIMSEELSWDKDRQTKEFEETKSYLKSMGLDIIESSGYNHRSVFSKQEMLELRKVFSEISVDGKVDLKLFKQNFAKIAKEDGENYDLKGIFDQVDRDKDGYLLFNDYLNIMASVKDIHQKPVLSRLIASKIE
jgi:glycerol-3-phosphate dehydrogenase